MVTIFISNKMAEKLWQKLRYKENEAWVYLRNKLFEATGFPRVMDALKKIKGGKNE